MKEVERTIDAKEAGCDPVMAEYFKYKFFKACRVSLCDRAPITKFYFIVSGKKGGEIRLDHAAFDDGEVLRSEIERICDLEVPFLNGEERRRFFWGIMRKSLRRR